MEDNREDIEYLVTVLSRHKELAQDLELITDMVGYEGESAEDAEDVMAVKNEMAQLKKVWNNYSETLRNFALYLSSNEEL
jgi:tRNA A37 methylthiotransferase MiaB